MNRTQRLSQMKQIVALGYKEVPEGVGEIKRHMKSFDGSLDKFYWVYTFKDPNLKPVAGQLSDTQEGAQVALDHFKRSGMINMRGGHTFNWHNLQKQKEELKGA